MSKVRNQNIFPIVFLVALSLIAEIFIFNFRYFQEIFSYAAHKTIGTAEFSNINNCRIGQTGITIQDGSEFYIDNPETSVKSIKLITDGSGSFNVSVSYTDENFSQSEQDAGIWSYYPHIESSKYIRLNTFGNCKSLKFTFSSTIGRPVIKSVELNSPYFHFSISRFVIFLSILFLIYAARHTQLWNYSVGSKKYLAGTSLCIIYFAAAIICAKLHVNYGQLPFNRNISMSSDIYQLLTQAFSNGQASLMVSPPEKLLNLTNPYDPSLRDFDYLFDSSFYNGKYYCYFGITPVITLMLPIKLLTGVYISSSFACFLYILLMLFAGLFLYYNIVMKWFPDTGFMPFLAGAIALVFGSGFFWLIARPMFYELAETCAITYLFLGFAFAVLCSRENAYKSLTLFASGLSFALMVASRPTFVFYIAASIPLILPQIIKKAGKLDLKRMVCFLTPLAVFAIILMVYNYVRFGSPFDFGQKYQLTVSDIRLNKPTNLAILPTGIYHYFFAPLDIDMTFPFFHVVQRTPDVSSGYYFNFPCAGLFNYPIMFILFASVYIIKRMGKERRCLKHFTALLIIIALIITYLDITLAGVLERYMLDITPVFMIASLILWFETLTYFERKGAKRPTQRLFFIICVATAVISTLATCLGENDVQAALNPVHFQRLSSLIEFWR